MRVQRVVMPSGSGSWTVLDDDETVVGPAEQYLAFLQAIERSPNTVRAYAHSLALWWEFLGLRGRPWDAAGVEDVAEFVRWLRAPADNVIVLHPSAAARSESTVNRHLAGLFGLYDFHARAGVALADSLVAWRQVPRGSYKPFLHHVTKGRAIRTRPVKLRAPKRLPRTLTTEEITMLLAACDRLRDRFLLALLAETGVRIGQALGLRHSDFITRRCEVVIVPRDDNANEARAKTRMAVTVPISAALARLYSAYMHSEYGELDSDYVFVNLWADPIGQPLRYNAVAKLVARLRSRTGIEFTPHMLRHSRATELIRGGVPIEIVAKLLTHRSVVTTSDTYLHLTAEDVAAELVAAGVWTTREGR
ncbi:MAG TPA: tyrosine-type recombinase/integrase [Euzebya sp.]|nr:tyrosine-type recombinase/integrase [Euzebya sp.]